MVLDSTLVLAQLPVRYLTSCDLAQPPRVNALFSEAPATKFRTDGRYSGTIHNFPFENVQMRRR
jgi:hypothetical protein